jgi:hypothetical protein
MTSVYPAQRGSGGEKPAMKLQTAAAVHRNTGDV